jgi:hypothetical protein
MIWDRPRRIRQFRDRFLTFFSDWTVRRHNVNKSENFSHHDLVFLRRYHIINTIVMFFSLFVDRFPSMVSWGKGRFPPESGWILAVLESRDNLWHFSDRVHWHQPFSAPSEVHKDVKWQWKSPTVEKLVNSGHSILHCPGNCSSSVSQWPHQLGHSREIVRNGRGTNYWDSQCFLSFISGSFLR